jgi:hypothetical protein
MSAARRAGASLTPSPVIATTSPLPVQDLGDAQLVLRRDPGDERPGIGQEAEEGRVVELVHGIAVRDPGLSVKEADRMGDGFRRDAVVAGDHEDSDAGASARAIAADTSGHGGSSTPTRPRSWKSRSTTSASEWGGAPLRRPTARTRSEARAIAWPRPPMRPDGLCQRTPGQDGGRRSSGVRDELLGHGVHGRHPLSRRVERDLEAAREPVLFEHRIDASS